MVNYELIRAIQMDRERDLKRAVRERSLRSALVTHEDVAESEARPASAESGCAPRLVAARPR